MPVRRHGRALEVGVFRYAHALLAQTTLALMLGTTRQTITGVARAFQRAGTISYKHARLRVLDREALQPTAPPPGSPTREALSSTCALRNSVGPG
jgi:hypothetical protein